MTTDITIRNVAEIASEINTIKDQTKKVFLLSSVEIGKRLVEAKELVPRGEWGQWLEESVDYSQRTANNLMKLHKEYGEGQLSLENGNGTDKLLTSLSYTQAVALLNIPADEREEFVEKNDVENMSTRELQKAIKEKEELENKLKAADQAAEKAAEEKKKIQEQFNAFKEKAEANQDEVESLQAQLEQAEQQEDPEEIERLTSSLQSAEASLKEYQQRVKELEKQAKEKPIDVPAIVERIPEETQKELESLRKQVASEGKSDAEMHFQYSFNGLVKGFQEVLAALEEVEDEEATTKYKNAISGLIDKMKEEL